MSDSELDLSQLALERPSSQTSAPLPKNHRRKWLTRYLVPGGILVGFAALIFFAAGQSLWPKPSVEVIPVIVKRTTAQPSGAPLFQAAGWIEPRPTATSVPALAPGVIEELVVVEGQSVEKGEPIAHLISIDAEIAVKEAEAALATATANLNRTLADQRAAKSRLEKPIHIQVQYADAKSLLAKAKTEWTNLPFQIEGAKANFEYAEKSVKGKRAAGKATPGVVLQKAEAELVAADARLRELQKRGPSLKQEIQALEEKASAIKYQLDLLVEEHRQLDEATANVQSATAMRDSAKLGLQKAKLDLDRNTVRAPIGGRILRVIAAPGSRVMGMETNGGHDSTSVVEMYDPQRLQVRADVRLEDVPLIQLGQPVEIKTASFQDPIKGRVLQPNSSANIQKNTLEVKVELISPPSTVRPEMLVTATFLAPETMAASKPEEEIARIFVPQQLLESSESGDAIWIVDANGRSKLRQGIELGQLAPGGLVEIIAGLQVTDKLIASGTQNLQDGQRVNVTGEERSIGR